jgi:hypothetical protein
MELRYPSKPIDNLLYYFKYNEEQDKWYIRRKNSKVWLTIGNARAKRNDMEEITEEEYFLEVL